MSVRAHTLVSRAFITRDARRWRIIDTARRPTRWLVAVVCAVLSALMHYFVIEMVVLGRAGLSDKHERGVGASMSSSEEEPLGVLIFIDEQGSAPSEEEPMESAPSQGKAIENARLAVADPKASDAPSVDLTAKPLERQDEASAQTPSTGDQAGQAALFGLYMNQIQARIERAWRRPRAAIAESAFDCRVQILQSKRGEVLEVTLQRCNGDEHWRSSLVRAIESASPLPAPPDPVVFSDLLRMSFHAAPYVAGGNPEGFESEVMAMATVAAEQRTRALNPPEPATIRTSDELPHFVRSSNFDTAAPPGAALPEVTH